MATIGVVVNPAAGKDIRRLASAASHTSDVAKIGIVRRVVLAAVEAGADRVLLSADGHRLAERAVDGIDGSIEVMSSPSTGSRLDTIAAAKELWKAEADVVVVLGGDGTCRDVATGWPDAPMLALSTGTNNVFPESVDATSAGTAAGLVALGIVDIADVATQAQRIIVEGDRIMETALVEVALIDTDFVGARAVQDAASIRSVLACIADPATTGLSSLAGRVRPLDRGRAGGILVETGEDGEPIRVPLSPGTFTTVPVAAVTTVEPSATTSIHGPGVLAFDGERHVRLGAGEAVTARISPDGPVVIDVDRVLRHPDAVSTYRERR